MLRCNRFGRKISQPFLLSTWFTDDKPILSIKGILSYVINFASSVPGSPWQQEAQGLSIHFQAAKDEPSFSPTTFTILSLFLFHSFGNSIILYNYFHLPDNSWWFHRFLTWFFCFNRKLLILEVIFNRNDLLLVQKYSKFTLLLTRTSSLKSPYHNNLQHFH